MTHFLKVCWEKKKKRNGKNYRSIPNLPNTDDDEEPAPAACECQGHIFHETDRYQTIDGDVSSFEIKPDIHSSTLLPHRQETTNSDDELHSTPNENVAPTEQVKVTESVEEVKSSLPEQPEEVKAIPKNPYKRIFLLHSPITAENEPVQERPPPECERGFIKQMDSLQDLHDAYDAFLSGKDEVKVTESVEEVMPPLPEQPEEVKTTPKNPYKRIFLLHSPITAENKPVQERPPPESERGFIKPTDSLQDLHDVYSGFLSGKDEVKVTESVEEVKPPLPEQPEEVKTTPKNPYKRIFLLHSPITVKNEPTQERPPPECERGFIKQMNGLQDLHNTYDAFLSGKDEVINNETEPEKPLEQERPPVECLKSLIKQANQLNEAFNAFFKTIYNKDHRTISFRENYDDLNDKKKKWLDSVIQERIALEKFCHTLVPSASLLSEKLTFETQRRLEIEDWLNERLLHKTPATR
ncbi:probable serine/threonine-protein kinase kinX isoform X1 [Gigantopelta aegis]|uniref:probable serine/threonine-protein kinase kinX isoform X1 n=1 Tax=Gigantopelta aegis TaxID=1735272 RepID=UPI001B88DF9E|nr:probable serine/threonine-protein kinase kinX isoform X1 [Gigantopelta aegis]